MAATLCVRACESCVRHRDKSKQHDSVCWSKRSCLFSDPPLIPHAAISPPSLIIIFSSSLLFLFLFLYIHLFLFFLPLPSSSSSCFLSSRWSSREQSRQSDRENREQKTDREQRVESRESVQRKEQRAERVDREKRSECRTCMAASGWLVCSLLHPPPSHHTLISSLYNPSCLFFLSSSPQCCFVSVVESTVSDRRVRERGRTETEKLMEGAQKR